MFHGVDVHTEFNAGKHGFAVSRSVADEILSSRVSGDSESQQAWRLLGNGGFFTCLNDHHREMSISSVSSKVTDCSAKAEARDFPMTSIDLMRVSRPEGNTVTASPTLISPGPDAPHEAAIVVKFRGYRILRALEPILYGEAEFFPPCSACEPRPIPANQIKIDP